MTDYRLICIYEKNPIAHRVRIEVNYDTKGKTLAPFLRKVSMTDLAGHVVPECCDLYQLMEHCGLTKQPFYLPCQIKNNQHVVSLLANYSYSYVQSGKGGSLKRGHISLLYSINKIIHTGTLLGGELYVSNMNSAILECAVRFRYADALQEFFPKYIDFPYLTIDNQLCMRDLSQEEEWLKMLSSRYDPSTGSLRIKSQDIDILQMYMHDGWKVYVQNSDTKASRVYAHQNATGITWFSTQEDMESDEIIDALLQSYLHNRHYQQIEDKVVICNPRDIDKITDGTLVARWKLPIKARNIYNIVVWKEQDKDIFLKDIQQKLKVKLFPYQEKGVVWLEEQRRNGHGCMLADEMGLGKTLQVIAYLTSCPTDSRHLIVVPSSLVFNWRNEIQNYAPSIYNQITIVSYDIVRLHVEDYSQEIYDNIIVDEVQMIKNRDTQRYAAITQLQGKQKIFLSGTPIENSVNELWAQFMVLIPEIKMIYSHIHSYQYSPSQEEYVRLSAKLLKPFILRRTKEEVMPELPDKSEQTIYIDLSSEERKIYTHLRSMIVRALTTGVTGRVNSLVLEGLLRLRQTCVSVNMLPIALRRKQHVVSSKLELSRSYIQQVQLAKKKILVFSQFVSALKELETILSEDQIGYVTLYGETRDRELVVHQFKENKEITVMLMSLKAGGVGLNLTEADSVILLDDWWNPAVEDQAIARAHRIGQNRNVLVLRLVCKDTIEEKILQLQESKRQTADMFNQTNISLSINEIRELLS